jgi:type VI secretion system protein VasG
MTLLDDRTKSPWDSIRLLRRLNPHCATTLEAASRFCQMTLADEITIEHWLLKLIESDDGDIPAILQHYGIPVEPILDTLIAAVDRLPRTLRGKPALSPRLAAVLQDAWLRAASFTDEFFIRSGNLLQAIVDAPQMLSARNAWPLLAISSGQIKRLLPRLGDRSCENRSKAIDDDFREPAVFRSGDEGAPLCPTPTLKSVRPESDCTIELIDRARHGQIDPVRDRDRDIQQIADVLGCRLDNNPIQEDDHGVGKTALVQGLALSVAEGDVANVIRDVRMLTLNLGLLRAGSDEFEQRLKNVIDEVRNSLVPVLLFIDETHTFIDIRNARRRCRCRELAQASNRSRRVAHDRGHYSARVQRTLRAKRRA